MRVSRTNQIHPSHLHCNLHSARCTELHSAVRSRSALQNVGVGSKNVHPVHTAPPVVQLFSSDPRRATPQGLTKGRGFDMVMGLHLSWIRGVVIKPKLVGGG